MTFMLPGNDLLCACDVAWLVLEPILHELIYDPYASRQWPAVWLWCGIAGVWAELAWTNTWPFCFQAMTYCVAVIRGPWYGQDFGKLFGNQEAPTFSGVLCGTYEGITKEKFIFSFSTWDSPQNWKFAFFCIKKNLLYLESNAWPKMLLL